VHQFIVRQHGVRTLRDLLILLATRDTTIMELIIASLAAAAALLIGHFSVLVRNRLAAALR